MSSIQALVNVIKKHNFSVGFSCFVDITHINNPHSFYVRPRDYNKFMSVLRNRGEKADASNINVGDVVIFHCQLLNGFERGRVMSVEGCIEPKYNLFAIDVGCVEQSVPLKNIWKEIFPTSFINGLATHCRLAYCAPIGNEWNDEAIDAMKYYVKGERAKIIVTENAGNQVVVEVYNTSPDDIATLLALTGFSTLGYVASNVND